MGVEHEALITMQASALCLCTIVEHDCRADLEQSSAGNSHLSIEAVGIKMNDASALVWRYVLHHAEDKYNKIYAASSLRSYSLHDLHAMTSQSHVVLPTHRDSWS